MNGDSRMNGLWIKDGSMMDVLWMNGEVYGEWIMDILVATRRQRVFGSKPRSQIKRDLEIFQYHPIDTRATSCEKLLLLLHQHTIIGALNGYSL
jgi:hypothetical protein